MLPVNTSLSRLLRIKFPLICPPMAGACGGVLAAHVSLAGAFGFLAAGYESIDKIRSEIQVARQIILSHRRRQSQPVDGPLPIGVGFLVWQLEKAADERDAFRAIDTVLQENVQALWFSFGQNIGRYLDHVRDRVLSSTCSTKPVIIVPVATPQEAVTAATIWGVDAIVTQGVESGGHGQSTAPPLLSLLSSVLPKLPTDFPAIAAGGLANGAHIAAMLTAGASGACLGTRFLLSKESLYTSAQQSVLLKASSSDSVRTMAFDYARGTLGWPPGIDGRAIRNDTVRDYETNVDMGIIRARFQEGTLKQDPDRMLVWAGSGVGLMDRIQSASDIVQELHDECVQGLQKANKILGSSSG